MKKSALLYLLLLLVQVSCQTETEDDPQPAAAALIQGEWVAVDLKIRYFDANGKQVHEQVLTGGGGNIYAFEDANLTVTYTDKTTEEGQYTVMAVDGKDFVEVTTGGLTNRYEIVTLTTDKLVWQEEYPSYTYYDGTQIRTADRALTVEEFRRR